MKKIYISLFALGLTLSAGAQTIATFEDDFTPEIANTITGATADQQAEYNAQAENPDKTGLNDSDKALYILSNQVKSDDVSAESEGRPSWNLNKVMVEFDEAVEITDANRYFHVMHWKERTMNNWLIYGVDAEGNEVELGRGTVADAETWTDLVVDIKAKMTSIKAIDIRLDGNWGSDSSRYYDPCKFYYDNLILSDDATPRGGVEYLTRQNILDFEDEAVTNSTVTYTPQSATISNDIVCFNELVEVPNTSATCASYNNSAYVWWQGYQFSFKKALKTEGYKYIHMMMRNDGTPTAAHTQASIYGVDGVQKTIVDCVLTGEWIDYVGEIPEGLDVVTGMFVKFNAPANATYYIDEIYMDNSAEPRTEIVSSVAESTISAAPAYSVKSNTLYINKAAKNSFSITAITGQRIANAYAPSFDLSQGIYILQIDNEVYKVLVK